MTPMTRLLCWLTGHRLTVFIPFDPGEDHAWHLLCKGRMCKCGKRRTVVMSDGTERETTV